MALLTELLDDVIMQKLNYQVDAEDKPAEIVVENFLKEKRFK